MKYKTAENFQLFTYNMKYNMKQDVFVKHNAPDSDQFQQRPRSQGQIF